jgi:tRNA-dependent cyclodipeptide synthase
MNNSAFIGVSLDSAIFSREWIRSSLRYVLTKHEDVLLLLADEILAYNKTLALELGPRIMDLELARARIGQRRDDIAKFLSKEIAFLPKADQNRIRLAVWRDFSDAAYAHLLRQLRIAYSGIDAFRSCVDEDASVHLQKHWNGSPDREVHGELCVSYVLDETAMDIRVTELAGYRFEYYPQDHIRTLTRLYENKFIAFGLTVAGLVEQPAQRVFTPLHNPPPRMAESRPIAGLH